MPGRHLPERERERESERFRGNGGVARYEQMQYLLTFSVAAPAPSEQACRQLQFLRGKRIFFVGKGGEGRK